MTQHESDRNELQNALNKLRKKVLRLESKDKEEGERIANLLELYFELQFQVVEQMKLIPMNKFLSIEPQKSRECGIGEKGGEQIQLGRGVFLPCTILFNVYRKNKYTIFIKELALAVYGEQSLVSTPVSKLDEDKLLAMTDIFRQWMNENNYSQEFQQKLLLRFDGVINETIQDLKRPLKPKIAKKEAVEKKGESSGTLKAGIAEIDAEKPAEKTTHFPDERVIISYILFCLGGEEPVFTWHDVLAAYEVLDAN